MFEDVTINKSKRVDIDKKPIIKLPQPNSHPNLTATTSSQSPNQQTIKKSKIDRYSTENEQLQ